MLNSEYISIAYLFASHYALESLDSLDKVLELRENQVDFLSDEKLTKILLLSKATSIHRYKQSLLLCSSKHTLGMRNKEELICNLLCYEQILWAKLHCCYVSQGSLTFVINDTEHKVQLPKAWLTDNFKNNLFLAFFIRWGWTLTEFVQSHVLVHTELDTYRVNYSSCSCETIDCKHKLFMNAILSNRTNYQFLIKQYAYSN